MHSLPIFGLFQETPSLHVDLDGHWASDVELIVGLKVLSSVFSLLSLILFRAKLNISITHCDMLTRLRKCVI